MDESVRWASPIMFGPRTLLLRTWGTRPIASDFLLWQGHPPGWPARAVILSKWCDYVITAV